MSWQTGGGWQDPLYILSLANTFTANQTISNTAPSLVLTDTTASAKSLTIAVDANLAQFRESAGAAGSLLVLDLVNARVGIGTGALALTRTFTIGGINASMRMLAPSGSSPQFVLGNDSGVEHWSIYETITSGGVQGALAIHDWVANLTRLTVSTSGFVGLGLGYTNPASLLDLRAGDLTMSGVNGQKWVLGRKTELITVASGVLTQASTITIPADAILEAASFRVMAQPGGTATMVVTATTSATVLQQGASSSTAVGTTDVGTRANGANYTGVAAQTVTFTFDGVTSDALGRIRLDIDYKQKTAATS